MHHSREYSNSFGPHYFTVDNDAVKQAFFGLKSFEFHLVLHSCSKELKTSEVCRKYSQVQHRDVLPLLQLSQ